jgi:arylsulfatase A-like enzyme/Flp pilus assembly protein TadD
LDRLRNDVQSHVTDPAETRPAAPVLGLLLALLPLVLACGGAGGGAGAAAGGPAAAGGGEATSAVPGAAGGGSGAPSAEGADGSPTAGAGGVAGARLNLVLVTLDTVRADHLGCYGDGAAETPELDRLAGAGVRFAHASSPVPLTLPSHTSILTGLLPLHHGVRRNGAAGLAAGTATLASRLAAAGYRTGAFVAAFVLDHRFGLQAGFEVYDDEVNRDPNAGWVLEAARPANQVVDRALAWLDHDDGRPFFLWVHLYDAHAPYNPPSPWRERHPGSPYDGAVAFDDAQLGRLLAEVDRRGGPGRTVVAVAADHGESLGEHGEQTHGLLLYEPALAVPLLLRAPGLAPRVVATPVSLVDLTPTLGGLLGVPLSPRAAGADTAGGAGAAAPGARRGAVSGRAETGGGAPTTAAAAAGARLDGRDLSAVLRAGQEPPAADLYAETRYPEVFGWSPLAALRRRDLKYITGVRHELYDLERDPHEGANLAAPAAQPAPAAAAAPATQAAPAAAGPAPLAARAAPAATAASATTATQIRAAGANSPGKGALQALAPRSSVTAASAAAATIETGSAADDADRQRLLRGFATQLAALEATAVQHPSRGGTLPGPAAPGGAASGTATAAGAQAPPSDAETRARLASLGYVAGGPPAAAPANPASASAVSRRGGAAGPDSRRQVELFERFEKAHAEQLAGRNAAAVAELESLVAADPPNPVFRAKLAQALRQAGDLGRAIPLYRQAAAGAPQDPESWYNLAAALRDGGQLREARAAIERALRLDPGRPEAHNTLGIVLLGEGRPEEARREFAATVAADPRNAHAWNNLGNVLRALRQPAAAEHAYRQALAVAPDYPEALNGLGTLAVQADRPAAALPFFDRALALAPNDQEVRLNRAIALQLAGNTAAAALAYGDFLRATAPRARQFAEQRQAARHFLAQLTQRGAAPSSRRPAGGG